MTSAERSFGAVLLPWMDLCALLYPLLEPRWGPEGPFMCVPPREYPGRPVLFMPPTPGSIGARACFLVACGGRPGPPLPAPRPPPPPPAGGPSASPLPRPRAAGGSGRTKGGGTSPGASEKFVRAFGPRMCLAAASYARAASSAVSKVPSHSLAPRFGSLISAAQLLG